jgi:hypothetical protein
MFVDEENRILPAQKIEIPIDKLLLSSSVDLTNKDTYIIPYVVNLKTLKMLISNITGNMQKFSNIKDFVRSFKTKEDLLKYINDEVAQKSIRLEFLENSPQPEYYLVADLEENLLPLRSKY